MNSNPVATTCMQKTNTHKNKHWCAALSSEGILNFGPVFWQNSATWKAVSEAAEGHSSSRNRILLCGASSNGNKSSHQPGRGHGVKPEGSDTDESFFLLSLSEKGTEGGCIFIKSGQFLWYLSKCISNFFIPTLTKCLLLRELWIFIVFFFYKSCWTLWCAINTIILNTLN